MAKKTQAAASRPAVARPARPSDRTRSAELTKRVILHAATRQFAEHGYRRAAIRDIAKGAGKNSALVRYYFGSKRRLYAEVLTDSAAP